MLINDNVKTSADFLLASQSFELHIVDKVINYSRLFRSTEACGHISRLPIKLNEDHSIQIAHDIITITNEGVLTNLTALSPTNYISVIK